MSDVELNQVMALALRLTDAEQDILLARLAATRARQADPQSEDRSVESAEWTAAELAELLKPSTPKTGAEIVAMLDAITQNDMLWSEMVNPQITDPVAWVKALRHEATRARNLDWARNDHCRRVRYNNSGAFVSR